MNAHSVLEETDNLQNSPSQPIQPIRLKPFILPAKQKGLFEDNFVEANSAQPNRRTWATLLSLVLESLFLFVLVLIPLCYTEFLPQQQLSMLLVAPSAISTAGSIRSRGPV